MIHRAALAARLVDRDIQVKRIGKTEFHQPRTHRLEQHDRAMQDAYSKQGPRPSLAFGMNSASWDPIETKFRNSRRLIICVTARTKASPKALQHALRKRLKRCSFMDKSPVDSVSTTRVI